MNQKTFLLLLIIAMIGCAGDDENPKKNSMGTWTQLSDYPGPERSGGIAFSVSGKGYWGMGSNANESFMADIWSFDPATQVWTQKKNFPFDRPAEAAVTIGDKAYVMTYSGSLYEYDPSNDSWKFMSPFPMHNRPGITGFSIGNKAYFGTGNNIENQQFTVYKDLWEFDPATNAWKQKADFPGVARTEAVSFVIGDAAYVGLGFDGVAAPPIYKDFWKYDPVSDSWSQIADFPQPNAIVGIELSNKTNAYIGLPENTQAHFGAVYEYTPSSNSWRAVKVFPSGASLDTNSFTIGDDMYVLGGWYTDHSKQVWKFTL
jgi:N-acetylneuraminic acid mutarotase